MTEPDPKTFLKALDAPTRDLVLALRQIIRGAIPEAEESVVWGSLSYHRPRVGGRVKGAVCQIVVRRGQVRLDFIHGIRLADPAQLLQGKLVSKRYIPINTVADLERPEILDLLRQAGTLEWQ